MKHGKLSRVLAGILCGVLIFANVGTEGLVYAAEIQEETLTSGKTGISEEPGGIEGTDGTEHTGEEIGTETGEPNPGGVQEGEERPETPEPAETGEPGAEDAGTEDAETEETEDTEEDLGSFELEEVEAELFAAEGDTEEKFFLPVKFSPKYWQNLAQGMLSSINSFRISKKDAWYWGQDNKQVSVEGLKELQWDKRLEELAMQRAAELVLCKESTRPNGKAFDTLFDSEVFGTVKENITAGETSSSAALKTWKKEGYFYKDQETRRNMLDPEITAMGAACVYYNKTYYWVMELGTPKEIQEGFMEPALTKEKEVQVELDENKITGVESYDGNYSVERLPEFFYGDSIPAPYVSAYGLRIKGAWNNSAASNVDYMVPSLKLYPKWKFYDEKKDKEFAAINGDRIEGLKVGEAKFRTIIKNKAVDFTLKIKPAVIIPDYVQLADSYPTQGEGVAIKPAVVTWKKGKLTEGTDYEINYENNTKEGTATVTVTGKGNFTGEVQKKFRIYCEHDFESSSVCSKCGRKKTQASDFTFDPPEDLVYDGYTKSAKLIKKNEIEMGWHILHYYDAEGKLLYSSPRDAGTYTVTVDMEEGTGYSAVEGLTHLSWTFTIQKAPAKITAINLTVLRDVSYIPYNYIAEDFLREDANKMFGKVTFQCDAEKEENKDSDGKYKTGTYEVLPVGPAEIDNYKITYLPGKVTITSVVENKEEEYLLKFGTTYSYEAPANGKSIAFTSRLESEEVKLEYKEKEETEWHLWELDTVTGNYFMSMTKGTEYHLRVTETENSDTGLTGITIGKPGYTGGSPASKFTIAGLNEKQTSGQMSVSRMSASYKKSGNDITASGTLKYIHNCSEYLGADGRYKSGYFLLFRMNVQKGNFKEKGYIRLSYVDSKGESQKQFYNYNDPQGTLKDGYVDVILDVTEKPQDVSIRVSCNGLASVENYTLKLADLQREDGGTLGLVTEPTENESFGVKTSSPYMKKTEEAEAEVLYDSVSYSTKVALAGGTLKGNYIALKVAIPDSMSNTKVDCSYTMEGLEEAADLVVYAGVPEGASYGLFILKAGKDSPVFGKTFSITWSPVDDQGKMVENTASLTQKIAIEKTAECSFDELPANALLPKSVAFNGLTTTMYTGQSQKVSITISKKYEDDHIRVSYSTSDNTVLNINRVTGVIQALKAGSATVTVEAVDAEGNRITKSAKITVKNPTAPASLKVSNVKDTSVTVSWGKNATGQGFEVYVVPYEEVYDKVSRVKAAQWKVYIEAELDKAPDEERPEWASPYKVIEDASCTQVEISGLQAETPYLFYVRNCSVIKEGSQAASFYAGSLTGKTDTKKAVFASIELTAQVRTQNETEEDIRTVVLSEHSFTVGNGQQLGAGDLPNKIGYVLLDSAGQPMPDSTVVTGISYKSSNKNIIAVDKNGLLTLGSQAGTAELSVTGKDASGTVRTSDVIQVTVRKAPTALKAKTTTLTIGQSITLKELIAYNVNGSITEIDVDQVDFGNVWDQLKEKECFVKKGGEEDVVSGDTEITASSLIKNNKGIPTSGLSVAVEVSMKDEETEPDTKKITTKATIKVNALAAPAIKSVAVNDTSAVLTFTPSGTVKEWGGDNYYYTVDVTDTVTNRITTLSGKPGEGAASGMTVEFDDAPGSTAAKPSYLCTVTGLSANKKYSAVITAHYDVNTAKNEKVSGAKAFTTRNRLLASDNNGKIDVTYISLTELKQDMDESGTTVFNETKDSGHIYLENNETYVLMAQVSKLARVLETDKLKWTISSGDKGSATIKATASTFEAKLTAVKTGTFTVTAESTVTKEKLATFMVTIIPYQSGSKDAARTADPVPVAYLSVGWENPFSEEKKKVA